MTTEVALHTPRLRIVTAMGAVAMAAVLLAPLRAGSDAETVSLCLFGVECIVPCYLLLRLGRSRSALEILVSVMAVAFLCWGALLLFRPGHPGQELQLWTWEPLQDFFQPITPYRYGFEWFQVRRWNWGLIALFYMVWLIEAVVTRPGRRPNEETARVPQPLRPRLAGRRSSLAALAVTFGLGVVLGWFWPWWSCAVCAGLLSAVWIAEAVSRSWRRPSQGAGGDPHVPEPQTSRLTWNPDDLMPALGGGMLFGLLWADWGWPSAVGVVSLLAVLVTQGVRSLAEISASIRSRDPEEQHLPQSQPGRPLLRLEDFGLALTTGILLGLLWSWSWWSSAVGVALALIVATAYRLWGRGPDGPSRCWAIALTAYWGFAFSAQLVVPPPRISQIRSPNIIRRKPVPSPPGTPPTVMPLNPAGTGSDADLWPR